MSLPPLHIFTQFLKSCSDLFSYNELNQVSLLTDAPAPPTKTADISTIGETTPTDTTVTSDSVPVDCTPIADEDNPCNQRTNENPEQLLVSRDSTELESSYDKALGELSVAGGEEADEGHTEGDGGKRGEGGDEEKIKDKRKPPPSSPAAKKRLVQRKM